MNLPALMIPIAVTVVALVVFLADLAVKEDNGRGLGGLATAGLMAVLGLIAWTGIARLTRAEFMKLKQTEFVTAAQSLGAGPVRVMFRHILPNSLAPVMVPIAFGIASAILIEAGLSLLGFGAPPPNPSWGAILQSGRESRHWWLIIIPGAAVFLTVLAYNLIGEGIQDATDPRLRQSS